MKIIHLLLLSTLLLAVAHGQRRPTTKPDFESTTKQNIRSRGRARFSLSVEELDDVKSTPTIRSRTASRPRANETPSPRVKPAEQNRGYQVVEPIYESPIDSFKRTSKPRILTETAYVASNAGDRKTLFRQSTPTAESIPVEDILQTFGGTARAIAAQNAARSSPRASIFSPRTPTANIDDTGLLSFDAISRTIATGRTSGRTEVPVRKKSKIEQPSRSSFPSRTITSTKTGDVDLSSFGEITRAIAAARTETPKSPALDRVEDIRVSNPSKTDYRENKDKQSRKSSRNGSRNQAANSRPGSKLDEAFLELSEKKQSIATTSAKPANMQIPTIYPEPPLESPSEFEETTLKPEPLATPSNIFKEEAEAANVEDYRVSTEPVTTKSSEVPRRTQIVRKISRPRYSTEEASSTAPRIRTRGRTSRVRQEDNTVAAASSRTLNRSPGRRPEEVRSREERRAREPSVFSAEESFETRSRTGRKISSSGPERIPIDLSVSNHKSTRTKSQITNTERIVRSRDKYSSKNLSSSAPVSKTKRRSRTSNIFNIDEKKLEVLPLFEAETKIVRTNSSVPTENDKATEEPIVGNNAKFIPKIDKKDNNERSKSEYTSQPGKTRKRGRGGSKDAEIVENVTRRAISDISKGIKSDNIVRNNVNLSSTTSKPIIQESVIAEFNEVTSKRTISRKKSKVNKQKSKTSDNVRSTRGKVKAEIVLTTKKTGDSEEEIEEEDNYPEAFKAIIQAEKNKKESRSSRNESHTEKSTTSTTQSTTAASATKSTTNAVRNSPRDVLQGDSELSPKAVSSSSASVRSSKNRKYNVTNNKSKSSTTKRPSQRTTKSRNTSRSSTEGPSSTTIELPKDHRFHAKFINKNSESKPTGNPGKIYSPKPPRGQYSSRKSKELITENEESEKISLKKEGAKQPSKSRYSSRYRNDLSQRGNVPRSTTSAPFYVPTIPTAAYTPTVPTVTPSTRVMEKNWFEDRNIDDDASSVGRYY